jgi:predicted dehydrogenase
MANERVIIVGAGGIAGAWLPNVVSEGLQVAAVIDIRREQAQKRIDEYKLAGAVAYDDLATALREQRADFAIDLTIPDAHCDVTCACLRAGLHVIGEKPMASTIDQAKKMVATARETGKLFMVSQSRRWDAAHATIAKLVRDRTIGDLTTLNCDFFLGAHFGGFRDAMESPLILDMAIHHFDQARLFAGVNAVSVYCEEWNPKGSWYAGDVAAAALFEMENGVRFDYRGSWCSEGPPTSWNGDWRVIGTDGSLLYAGDKLTGQVVDRTKPPAFSLPRVDLAIEPAPMPKLAMAGGLDEMLRFLRTGQRPQTHAEDNIQSLAMVLAAIKSSREGRRVKIAELLA